MTKAYSTRWLVCPSVCLSCHGWRFVSGIVISTGDEL